jgi:hypothetical protein
VLEGTKHDFELSPDPSNQVHVHVDCRTMGLGGVDSWSPNVPSEHLIATGRSYSGTVKIVLLY